MILARNLVPELMDDPELDPIAHQSALKGLQKINAISCSTSILWPPIADAARRRGVPLRILDLACGGGDNVLRIAWRAAQDRLPIEIHGCDISAVAVAEAKRRAGESSPLGVAFFQQDVVERRPSIGLRRRNVFSLSAPPGRWPCC